MNHNFDVDGLDREITVTHIKGVEGPSLYLNDRRVSGPKPWGGGSVVREWKTSLRDILEAVLDDRDEPSEELTRLAREDALGFHQERRRQQTPRLIRALTALAATSTEEPRA
jgi:hypothetical protein